MSCDWNVHCVDCGETLHFDDANHQRELMREIIRMRDALAQLGDALAGYGGAVEIRVATSYGDVDPAFFARHRGHKLVPIDEYGQRDGDCGERFACECCGSGYSCRLPLGHAGAHSRGTAKGARS